jgi:hypothetical protein
MSEELQTNYNSLQLPFGKFQVVCTHPYSLLYIENYHKDPTVGTYIFESYSPSCSANISTGSIGLLLIFIFAGIRLYFLRKREEPSRNVILGLAVSATVWAFVMFVVACIFSSGLGQTCREFGKNTDGKTCGAVFGEGFFANSTEKIYKKNVNTINAALGAVWAGFVGFVLYAAYEFYNWRHASLKWW